MKERPMLFSDPMVRAILSGQKTQTRRVVNPYPPARRTIFGYRPSAIIPQQDGAYLAFTDGHEGMSFRCPYGQPGDRLWVRECFAIVPRTAYRNSAGVQQTLRPDDDHDAAVYRADWERSAPSRWRPSIHMPRWACRLVLEIVSVRVERLEEISREDALAEGIEEVRYDIGGPYPSDLSPVEVFSCLWSSINGIESWNANPWVWVVEFKPASEGAK